MRKEEGDLRRLLCKPKSIKILITERIEKRSKVMRLKKFLSAALSAAMLISCVSFGGAVNVNGIPAGKTIRGVIYAKVTDKETQQTKWVYSEEVRLTNK